MTRTAGFRIRPESGQTGWALSPSQASAFLDWAFAGFAPAHCPRGRWWITGPFDADRFLSTVRTGISISGIARIAFDATRPLPCQHVLAEDVIDLQQLHAATAASAERRLQSWLREPVTVGVRSLLITVSEQQHLWALRLHPALADRASVTRLARRIFDLYVGQRQGAARALRDASLADILADASAYEASDRRVRDRSYWPATFAGRPQTSLGLCRSIDTTGGSPVISLDSAQLARLKHGAARLNTQPAMMLAAALACYSAQTIGIANPVLGLSVPQCAARLRATVGATSGLIAFPLAVDVADSFADTVRNSDAALRGSLRHRRYPIDELHRDLGLQILRGERLLDLSVSWDDATQRIVGSLQIAGEAAVASSPAAPLLANVADHGDRLEIVLQDATGGRHAEMLALAADRFVGYLMRLLEDPVAPVRDIPVVDATERQNTLETWNNTRRDWPGPCFLAERFSQWASATPFAPALADEGKVYDYVTANRFADRLARRLRRLEAKPETVVAVYLDRSAVLVLSMLAIWRAGAAYMPLDPAYPAERLAFMCDDASPAIIITDRGLASRLPPHGARVLMVDVDESKDELENPVEPTPQLSDLAYVIYTSGSTGRPKGVMVEHRGLVNLAAAQAECFGVEAASRVLQFASPNFDAFISEVAMAIQAGASLHLAATTAMTPGPPLAETLRTRAITHVTLPPSALSVMLPADLPSDLTLIVAGEACPHEIVSQWAPGRPFFNAYGPTETTVCATVEQCHDEAAAPPIGRPIANTRVYLLAAQMMPVPVGAIGEIHVGGLGVARGYHRRPELTAERFVASPFVPGDRLYRTGDLGRYRRDGRIDFLGRADQQVKVRGYRVELGEVEAALAADATVAMAVAVVDHSRYGHSRLLAYVVPRPGAMPTAASLRRSLTAQLPNYMVPSVFTIMDALPLLPNGKIDRSRLPAPDPSRSSSIGQVGPRDSIEVKLALLWQEILGVEAPGVFDDFFDVGGDSLQAARFAARVADLFGRRIELAAMAENATIDVIARQVRRNAGDGAWSPLVAMRSTGTRPPLFVVHPAGGTILSYVDLSRSLPIEQPFFGIQAYGYEPDQTPDTNVEAMAARYVDALLAEFPEGPYRLAGWSFGAVVALEMAQQLRRGGREVDRLIIIDAALGLEQPHHSEDDIIQRLIGLYSQLVTQGATVVENELSDLAPAARTRLLIERAVEARLFPADFNVEQARRLARIVASCFEAGKAYVPRPYGGRLTLVRASRMPITVLDEALGWSEVAAGRFELIWTAGDHLSMMRRPDVAVLADRIWAVLENHPLIGFRSPVPAAS